MKDTDTHTHTHLTSITPLHPTISTSFQYVSLPFFSALEERWDCNGSTKSVVKKTDSRDRMNDDGMKMVFF